LAVKPISDLGGNQIRLVFMSLDIGIRQVRDGNLKSVFFRLKDETSLAGPLALLEQSAANIDAQFEWHIQPKEFALLARLQSRQIVDGKLRLLHESDNPVDSGASGIRRFKRDLRYKSEVDDGE
jgi:hypothetical protein